LSWLRRKHSDSNPPPARPAPLRGPFPAGSPGDQFDVLLTVAGDRKIQVIKVVRECTGYGLRESKELVDRLDYGPVVFLTRLSRYDADRVDSALALAGATVAVRPSAAVGGPDWQGEADDPDWQDETDDPDWNAQSAGSPVAGWRADPPGDQFTVVLTAAGNKKIQVIKAVREYTGYGLKEAKDLVDASAYGPVTLTAGLVLPAANQMAAALTRAGATVTVTGPPGPEASAASWS
jgi:ribosomal protein L7/L12